MVTIMQTAFPRLGELQCDVYDFSVRPDLADTKPRTRWWKIVSRSRTGLQACLGVALALAWCDFWMHQLMSRLYFRYRIMLLQQEMKRYGALFRTSMFNVRCQISSRWFSCIETSCNLTRSNGVGYMITNYNTSVSEMNKSTPFYILTTSGWYLTLRTICPYRSS
jgi:hypothetical protein